MRRGKTGKMTNRRVSRPLPPLRNLRPNLRKRPPRSAARRAADWIEEREQPILAALVLALVLLAGWVEGLP